MNNFEILFEGEDFRFLKDEHEIPDETLGFDAILHESEIEGLDEDV